jgi:hypothetical protein
MHMILIPRPTSLAALLWLAAALTCPASADDSSASAGGSGFDGWCATSDAAKESQPHWITPVVTVTPRLEQEYRYDQSWQARPNNVTLDNYGAGKGFELIPTLNTELIIGVPGYQVRTNAAGRTTGWADETFLVKYRFAAENEEHGNYIVTGPPALPHSPTSTPSLRPPSPRARAGARAMRALTSSRPSESRCRRPGSPP